MQLVFFIRFGLSFAFIMNSAHNIDKSGPPIVTPLGRVICQVISACHFKSGHIRVGMASNNVENNLSITMGEKN